MCNLVDKGSKYAYSFPIISKTAAEVMRCLRMWRNFEPEVLFFHTDNGTEYNNKLVREFLAIEGIVHKFSKPYHPQDAGTVEAFNRTIKDLLFNIKLGQPELNLCDGLTLALSAYNNDH